MQLAHFQIALPADGLGQRLHSLESFGQLQVYLVDVYDVFLSKLFSIRTKDLDDLRMLKPQLDKESLARRLTDTTRSMLAAPGSVSGREQNWYILYGEPLPT